MPYRLQPRIDLIIELQEIAERLRTEANAIRTNIRIQTTNDANYPVLAEGLAEGTFSLTGGMSMLGYQGDDIHDAPTVRLMRTTGVTIVQRDTAVDPPLVPIAREFGGQAGQMLAPVHHDSTFCGFIAVHGDSTPRDWSAQDQDHLTAAVSQVESILSKATWFERPEPSTMKHLLAVLSDPIEGREDEYNDWYSGPHIDETLRTPGWIAARRFALAGDQISENIPAQRYLALFELSTDAVGDALDTLRSHSGTFTTSDSISPDDVVGVFTPITDRIESK